MSLNPRKVLTGAAVGVAALSLIGAGAGASFTDSVTATQEVSTGDLELRIVDNAKDGAPTEAITFEVVGNQGSKPKFSRSFTVSNVGTLAADLVASVRNTGSAGLAEQLLVNVRIDGQPVETGTVTLATLGTALADLSDLDARTDSTPGEAVTVDFDVFTDEDGLSDGLQNKTLTTVITVAANEVA